MARQEHLRAGWLDLQADDPKVERLAVELTELFYPQRYQGFMLFEDVTRGGLTRVQAATLWMIRAEGSPQNGVPRKKLDRALRSWFGIGGPALTKSLNGLVRSPNRLVRVVNDPRSGREKRVLLTPKGRRFIEAMVSRGLRFMVSWMRTIPEPVIRGGIDFLRASLAATAGLRANYSGFAPGANGNAAGHTGIRHED